MEHYEDISYIVDGHAAIITIDGGLSQLAMAGLDVFAVTDEAREGAIAFAEKRKPDFARHAIEH